MIEELVSRVFATRNAAHLAHWRETSGFRHETLGDFYEALISGVDEIIEDYQGAFGLIADVSALVASPENIDAHIADEAKWIGDNRDAICRGDEAIAARLDDLKSLYLRTAYKLFNLK